MNAKWLEMLKKQIRVDFDDEDEVLQHHLNWAEQFALNATNRTRDQLYDLTSEVDDYPLPFIQAIVMLAATHYENGESLVSSALRENPFGVWALLNQYYLPG